MVMFLLSVFLAYIQDSCRCRFSDYQVLSEPTPYIFENQPQFPEFIQIGQHGWKSGIKIVQNPMPHAFEM